VNVNAWLALMNGAHFFVVSTWTQKWTWLVEFIVIVDHKSQIREKKPNLKIIFHFQNNKPIYPRTSFLCLWLLCLNYLNYLPLQSFTSNFVHYNSYWLMNCVLLRDRQNFYQHERIILHCISTRNWTHIFKKNANVKMRRKSVIY